jgi:RHS repeat-associated protein
VYDAATSLSYLNARYYNSAQGQFVSQDPIFNGSPKNQNLSNPQSLNTYSYALDNPVTIEDPSGKAANLASIIHSLQGIVSQLQQLVNTIQGNSSVQRTEGIVKQGTSQAFSTIAQTGQNTYNSVVGNSFLSTGPILIGGALELEAGNPAPLEEEFCGKVCPGLESLPNPASVANDINSGEVNVDGPYSRPAGATTPAQRASVQGFPCPDCGATGNMVANHINPLVVQYYTQGSLNQGEYTSLEAVGPQCPSCSASQGGVLSNWSQQVNSLINWNSTPE